MDSKKKYLFFIGILFLAAGALFSFKETGSKIVYWTGLLLNKELDHSFWDIGFSRVSTELIAAGISVFIFLKYQDRFPRQVFLYLSAGWIVLFFVYVLNASVNIPMTDDYSIIAFLNNYVHSKDLSKIVMQYDEDREFLIRFLSVILFHLKMFDFRILILFANVCLLGSVIILYKVINPAEIPKELFLFFLTFLIFHFEFYDAIVLTSGAMYHACSIFFSAACLFFLVKNGNKYFIFAMLFAVAAILNNGSGFILLFIGTIFLLREKRMRHFAVWMISGAIIIFLYFHFYSTSSEHYSQKIEWNFPLERIMRCILFSFTFMGNATQFLYDITLPIVSGAMIWMYFVWLTYKKYYKKNSTVYFIFLYLLLTSWIPPLVKPYENFHSGLEIRYGIYSVISIACCFIAWFENERSDIARKKFAFIFTMVFLYHLATAVFFYPEVIIRKERLVAMIHNIRIGKTYVRAPLVTRPNAELLIKEAVHNDYYFPDY